MRCLCQTIVAVLLQLHLVLIGHDEALFLPSAHDRTVSERTPKEICLTPGCVKAAAEILNNMDASVDPCENFYRFACGGWMKSHTVPDDKSSVNRFSELTDDLETKLRVLLEEPLTGTEPSFIKAAKNMYGTCTDVKTIESLGDQPLKKVLDDVGGWPVLQGGKWDPAKFDWIDMLIKLRKMGFNHNVLMYFSVDKDTKNNTHYVISLYEPSLGLPGREYYMSGFNDSVTKAYFDVMVKLAVKLGADKDVAKDELLRAFEFETELAKYKLPAEEKRNASSWYNKFTVSELQEMAPQVDWLRLLNGILTDKIEADETVILSAPSYFRNFSRVIANADKRSIANYMVFRAVAKSIQLMSKEWRSTADELTLALTGRSQEPPRWKQCFSAIRYDFLMALSSYYVRHHFNEESKAAAMEMVKYIRKEFLNILETIDWMDNETRSQAIEKANAMSTWIGYPDQLLDNQLVSEYYANVSLTENSYFDNVLRMTKWQFDSSYNLLRTESIKGDWKSHASAAMVNAFYDFLENSIEFPAGILQIPFFSAERPNYMNFGGIGFVIGHEITHGFDDRGRQFDKDGNNNNWWDPKTDEKFKKKAQCIVDQYSNYTVPEVGININGINTQGENIADNGGVKEAYRAYKSWVADHGEEQMLPALNYTPLQLFWIAAANIYCGKSTDAMMKHSIKKNPHSPLEFRVIGVFSNSPDFANDFSCRLGSPMNPEHKCEVW